MKKMTDMLQLGKLSEAISHLEMSLKDDPMNIDFRSSLIELLCIKGELERADKQLNIMVQKHPEFLVGATNLRQLIRAEQSRQDFSKGNAIPALFNKTNDYIEALMKLNLEIRNGDKESIAFKAEQMEKIRPQLNIEINGKKALEVRDLDDSLGGYIEIFGTDGKFYLADLSEIEYLTVKPVTSLIEQVWRRVDLSIKDGPCGEAHIPVVYVNSTTEAQKLGRETDWQEVASNVMLGLGKKMWFVDDSAVVLSDIVRINYLDETDNG